jgi:hypothetical protein
MGIKKLIVSGCNSLNLLGAGELTPFFITPKNPLKVSSLTPVSKRIGYCFIAVFFINLRCFA